VFQPQETMLIIINCLGFSELLSWLKTDLVCAKSTNNDFKIILISVEFPLICVGIRIQFVLVKKDFLSNCFLEGIFS